MEAVLGLLLVSAMAFAVFSCVALAQGRIGRLARWAGTVAAAGEVGLAVRLWSTSWDFAEDIVLVALPPLVAAVALAPPVGRPAGWRQQAAAAGAILNAYAIVSPPIPPYLPDAAWTVAVLATATGLAFASGRLGRRPRVAVAVVVVAGVAAAGLVTAAASRLPADASMTEHGVVDYGGGDAGHEHDGVDVSTLTGPTDQVPDRRFTLTAREVEVRLPSGERVAAWTFNGTLPGPELRVRQGDLVEVTLINANIDAGVTIHWHGLDVPNAEDGVAGLTQDAVRPGGRHVYRFVAEQAGSFWYHSHQQSNEQVRRGLFGALVVSREGSEVDLVVLTHAWSTDRGQLTALSAGGQPSTAATSRTVTPGERVRLRLTNADNKPRVFAITGTTFRVTAIDGTDLSGPTPTDRQLLVGGGGRYDVEFTMPRGPVQVALVGDTPTLLLSPDGKGEPRPVAEGPLLDPSTYGTPAGAPPTDFDRTFTLLLGETIGFYNGQFGQWTTIGGAVSPETPALAVREGDLVKVTFLNRGFEDHPMHLHGHHMRVLSRDGRPVTGSPWWTDTLNVAPGERYEVAFRADNPGLWMDHCHNLEHAAEGMTMHLMYLGYHSPYRVGPDAGNQPE
jgi:FtsP/CotA-like multicopper oxidase with cupredoxin domain